MGLNLQNRKVRFGIILASLLTNVSLYAGELLRRGWDFSYDVAPLFARHGCAAADCHGGATGRGGFKLSLFATDARADYRAIVQDLDGRRIDRTAPASSLVLLKPTRQMKHQGGKRFGKHSAAHQTLTSWIAAGAPFQEENYRILLGIKIARNQEDVRVYAAFEWADGKLEEREVTNMSRFSTTDPAVLTISDEGNYEVVSPGKAAIIAHYAGHMAREDVVNPYAQLAEAPSETAHPLDKLWLTHLARLGLRPPPQAPPETLARRLYLDLAGRIPSPDESRRFVQLPPEARIERSLGLLHDHALVDALAPWLWEWFEVPPPGDDDGPKQDTYRSLRNQLVDWRHSDSFMKDLSTMVVASEGPPRQFLTRFADPRDRAEYVGRTLLGLSIGCARCHNHPMDRWRQDQHLQFSAMFADPRPNPDTPGGMMAGKFFLPGSREAIAPVLLPVFNSSMPEDLSPKKHLQWLVLDGASHQVARNVANRVFALLIGRPLVESVEDHRLTNPAIDEAMLELLAEELQSSGGDVRDLMRLILTSRLYAATSAPDKEAQVSLQARHRYLALREARSLTDLQLKQSIEHALGVGLRNWKLSESPLARQLALLNSGVIQEALAAPGNQVEAIHDFEHSPSRRVESLFQLILSRAPTAEESASLASEWETLQDARDLALALFLSREFSSHR